MPPISDRSRVNRMIFMGISDPLMATPYCAVAGLQDFRVPVVCANDVMPNRKAVVAWSVRFECAVVLTRTGDGPDGVKMLPVRGLKVAFATALARQWVRGDVETVSSATYRALQFVSSRYLSGDLAFGACVGSDGDVAMDGTRCTLVLSPTLRKQIARACVVDGAAYGCMPCILPATSFVITRVTAARAQRTLSPVGVE